MITRKSLQDGFKKVYKRNPTVTYFSPGRVNLIGEHIDYHGGLVFPAALTIGTFAAAIKRDDEMVRVYSEGYTEKPVIFSLHDLSKDEETSWANYIRGVFKTLISEGYQIKEGIDLYLHSSMPSSGGLSSSSSLELLLIKLLSDMFNLNIDKTAMALLGKKVENEYIGVLTGIMDQFVIAHGKKDHALLLNTSKLIFDYIPLDLKEYALVIVNTNKRRGLADSKYNERYTETMDALKILQEHYKITHLVELKSSDLPKVEEYLDPLTFRRVRHIITEQERTINSAKALQKGDILSFAKYLSGSHDSLRDDYEVTGVELDTLVSLLRESGAIGARMTGAGFGGCAIGIVPKEKVKDVTTYVTHYYTEKIGYQPTFFTTAIGDGTHAL